MKNVVKVGLVLCIGTLVGSVYQGELFGMQPSQWVASVSESILMQHGNEPDPLTGKNEPGRSCLQKDAAGKCIEWKVSSRGKDNKLIWVAERVCTAPQGGSCNATVVRGHDIATCNAEDGASCRARVIIR